MKKFDVIALANTFAIIDIILHQLFRLWVLISPQSYIKIMHLFIEGLQLQIDSNFDLNFFNFITGTLLEATIFWVLGASLALIYNKLSKN